MTLNLLFEVPILMQGGDYGDLVRHYYTCQWGVHSPVPEALIISVKVDSSVYQPSNNTYLIYIQDDLFENIDVELII